LLDCDVEEPNAHIFLKPQIEKREDSCIPVPNIDDALCVYCNKCVAVCAYNALALLPPRGDNEGSIMVFENLCHGCGACAALCPRGAIKEVNRKIGVIESGRSGAVSFVGGKLNIGEAMAPPLIRDVKKHIDYKKTVIIDAPPGTSCPVVVSIKGSDFCVLVTEPTPFGLNDLILSVDMLKEVGIPFGVVINRSDLGDDKTHLYCNHNNIPILMEIPFKKEIAEAYSRGKTLLKVYPQLKIDLQHMYKVIESIVVDRKK